MEGQEQPRAHLVFSTTLVDGYLPRVPQGSKAAVLPSRSLPAFRCARRVSFSEGTVDGNEHSPPPVCHHAALTPDFMSETTYFKYISSQRRLKLSHFSSAGGRGTKQLKHTLYPMSLCITPLFPKVMTSSHPLTERTCLSKKGTVS